MKRINKMDMNNTPFEVDSKFVHSKDSAYSIPMNFSGVSKKNSERFLREVNNLASKVLKDIEKLKAEVEAIPVDREIDTVVLDIEYVNRISKLVENISVSFSKIVDSAN